MDELGCQKLRYLHGYSQLKPPSCMHSQLPEMHHEITFTDKSTGSPTSRKWSFGDGTYSTQKNTVHKYSKVGKYIVSLTVTNAKGSNTKTIPNYIAVKK